MNKDERLHRIRTLFFGSSGGDKGKNAHIGQLEAGAELRQEGAKQGQQERREQDRHQDRHQDRQQDRQQEHHQDRHQNRQPDRQQEHQGQPDIKETWDKLLPPDLLKMLKKTSYAELKVGDLQYTTSVILSVNTAGFSEFVHGRQAEEIFSYINRLMEQLIPIIYRHGGFVEGFEEGGLTALFGMNREAAVAAGIAVREAAVALNTENPVYAGVTAGLFAGPLMIGVVGHSERMNLLALSEAKEFAGFLRSLGPKYYAGLIASSEFLPFAGAGKNYNYRLLGYIRVRSFGTVEKVYDMFDGEEIRVRNKKRRTRMVFEKGVSLYMEKNMPEARQHFIEVLKTDHEDRAAREYLLRCDAFMNGKNEELFLETY